MTAAEQAREAASTAAAIARSAAEQARAAAEVERERVEQVKRDLQNAIRFYGQTLLEESPLEEWFPGQTWGWADLPVPGDYQARYVVRPQEGEKFFLILTRQPGTIVGGEVQHLNDVNNTANRPVRVLYATQNRDTGTGYLYWSSAEVKGPADIGRFLLERGDG